MISYRLLQPSVTPNPLRAREEAWVLLPARAANDYAQLEFHGAPAVLERLANTLYTDAFGEHGRHIEARTTARDLRAALRGPVLEPWQPCAVAGLELFDTIAAAVRVCVADLCEALVDFAKPTDGAIGRTVESTRLAAALAEELLAKIAALNGLSESPALLPQLQAGAATVHGSLRAFRVALGEVAARLEHDVVLDADARNTASQIVSNLLRLVTGPASMTATSAFLNELAAAWRDLRPERTQWRHACLQRHRSRESDDWRDELAIVCNRLRIVLDRGPSSRDPLLLLKGCTDAASLAVMFNDQQQLAFDCTARGAGAGHAALLSYRFASRGGDVLLTEPRSEQRVVPVGAAALMPFDWVNAFSLAVLARDSAALVTLCAPVSIACVTDTRQADPFWAFFCSLLAAAALARDGDAQGWYDEFRRTVKSARIATPRFVEMRVGPTAELVLALAQDEHVFERRLDAALIAHRLYFEDESRCRDPGGLLALWPLAVASLAAHRGWRVSCTSNYMHPRLLSRDYPRELSKVAYYYPDLCVIRDAEADVYLDLAGFPRSDRTHERVLSNSEPPRRVLRVEARGAPGVPVAVADFVLLDSPHTSNDPAMALDAGQLLAAAERFAGGEDDSDELSGAARLDTALACVQGCLERIPAGDDAIDSASITSEAGRLYYAREPGRFQRERLQAYLDGIAAQRAALGSVRRPPPETQDAGLRGAEVLAELAATSAAAIRAEVLPLLRELPGLTPDAIAERLAPHAEDFEAVFVGEAVEIARAAYLELWRQPVQLRVSTSSTPEIHVAPAGLLTFDSELTRSFPGGYRTISRWLEPSRVWVAWRYLAPGDDRGMAFDGLVLLGERWAWFPKPYRVLRCLPH